MGKSARQRSFPLTSGESDASSTPLPLALGGKPRAAYHSPPAGAQAQLELIQHSAYFTSDHQIAKAIVVVAIEIDSDVAINFVHSEYDTHAFPVGFIDTQNIIR